MPALGRAGQAATVTTVPPDLGALYLRHRDAMHRVAASVLREAGRASEASDAVSDAMVSIMASPRDVRNWEAFLVTAAKRKALDRVRSAESGTADPSSSRPHMIALRQQTSRKTSPMLTTEVDERRWPGPVSRSWTSVIERPYGRPWHSSDRAQTWPSSWA